MDREGAVSLLSDMCAATSRPALSPERLEDLVDRYATADRYDVFPGSDGWEPTWNLNAAAAEAWRLKASAVAGDFNFSADGASYSKADVLAHCLEMEAKYAALSHGTMQTAAHFDPMRLGLPADWDGNLIP